MYAAEPYGSAPYATPPPVAAPLPPGLPVPAWGLYGVSPIGAAPYGTAPPAPAPLPAPPAEHALFLSSLTFDGARLQASSEVSSLPVGNLKDLRNEKKWRLEAKLDQYLSIDLAKPVACNTVALVGSNLGALGVCRVIAGPSGSLPQGPYFDSGWMSVWPPSGKPRTDQPWPVFTNLVRFVNDTPFPSWRILFGDPGVESAYLEFGRILIGRAFRPTYNVDVNPAIGLESSDVRRRSTFNRTFTDPRGASSRRMALSLSAVDRDEMRADLFELQRYCGLARDFVFSLDPAATTSHHLYTMQALFVEGAQFEAQPLWDANGEVWRTSLQLTEPL